MGLFDKLKSSKATSGKTVEPKALRVSDFLTAKTIVFFPSGPSKQQVFGSLISALELPDAGTALKAIMAREEAGSTVIAPGLALPHARIQGIPTIKAALGICPSGIHYSHTETTPVRLIMLFLGPADNMREHLAFLASVSALFQTVGLPEALVQMTAAKPVLQKLRDTEKIL